MGGLDLFGEDDSGTVFRDVIMLALAGFVAIVLLLLPFINPEAKQAAGEAKAPGNVIVEIQVAGWARRRCRSLGSGTERRSGRLLEQGWQDLQPAAR